MSYDLRLNLFTTFGFMRVYLLFLICNLCINLGAQDKIYYTNGLSKQLQVLQISADTIIGETDSTTETILTQNVLLIEYKNGTIDVFNLPTQSKIINTNSVQKNNIHNQNKPLFNYNLVSYNALALCNADASAFYERILQNKKIGLGIMGAYNFNIHSIGTNAFISILNNAKKNYDLGIYLNYYPKAFSKKTSITYGILFKQTNFSYNIVTIDSVTIGGQTSSTISFKPTSSNQFATIFNIGTHTTILPNFFIKTFFGIGGFNLRGDYKTQFNYEANKQQPSRQQKNNTNKTQSTISFLPKLYIGINIGFAF